MVEMVNLRVNSDAFPGLIEKAYSILLIFQST